MAERPFVPVIDHLRTAAERHPDRPAFVGRDVTVYRSFGALVRSWADLFVARGLEKGGRVAIWLPKRLEYVTAIYAAMEAGGIYVPLDGTQPPDRARKILASAEPTILVTDWHHWRAIEGIGVPSLKAIIVIEGAGPSMGLHVVKLVEAGEQTGRPAGPFHPDPQDIAAILFTSGSTGVPKGVQISYGNLHNFIGWAVDEFGLCERDVLANHAGFHFDLSTFDLFAAAAAGAAVWIVREDEQRNVSALAEGIEANGVTVWYSVPSVLTLLVSSQVLSPEVTARLRHVLFAGEVFPIKHLCALKACLPAGCQLYNLYGPTETNVCLFYRVRDNDLQRNKPVYIGEPLPGVEAQVVDEQGNPVGQDGEIGELIISGLCVTPGYRSLNDPRNDDNHRQGRHATGDLVSYEGGYLQYYGRKDRMVKISGNRVELGEIESALSAMPEIREVGVVVEVTESAQSVVAFYSLQPEAAKPGLIAIKQHCSRLLPRYMIPKTARHVTELPKNQNGKIDYLALGRLARGEEPGAPVARQVPATAEVAG
jgi:amino acid adenylation domain-containing protein